MTKDNEIEGQSGDVFSQSPAILGVVMTTGAGKARPAAQSSEQALPQLDETILAMVMARNPLPEILAALCTGIE